jgi:hypothetical protein
MNRQDFLGRNKTGTVKPKPSTNKTETVEEQGDMSAETGKERQAINSFRLAWKKQTGEDISRTKAKELMAKNDNP